MLVGRSLKLSHHKFHRDNLALIKKTLLDNSYPEDFVNKQIHLRMKRLNHLISDSHAGPVQQSSHLDFKHTLIFPFVDGLTQNLNRIAKKFDLQVISQNEYKVNKLLRPTKDPVQFNYKSNVVYSIPCKDCTGVYIGQTKRYIKTRIEEHEKGVANSANIDEKKYTALIKHSVDLEHQFSFKDTKICTTETSLYKRNLLEMINIVRQPHAINFRTDVNKLSGVYRSLLS